VWQRRQEMPPQQATTGPTPMEEVERTDAVMICPQQRVGSIQRSPYAMDVDRRKNRNCYSCGGFGHLARNCRNRRIGNKIGEGRRLEYGGTKGQRRMGGGNRKNLNREQDLILLD